MIISDLAQASQAVSSAHQSYLDYLSNEKGHNKTWADDSRTRRFAMLGALYATCLALDDDRDLLAQLCVQEGVQVPDATENPFAPTIRLVCRTKDQKGNLVPAKNSTWIYSKYFRAAQFLGWASDEFATNVATYEFDDKAKKKKWLAGLAALDTKEFASPNSDFEARKVVAARSWTSQRAPQDGLIHGLKSVEAPKHGQMIGLVAEWNAKASVWIVRGVHQADDEKAFALISKVLTKDFEKHIADEAVLQQEANLANNPIFTDDAALLDAVAEQNREQGLANDAVNGPDFQGIVIAGQSSADTFNAVQAAQ